MNSNTTPRPRDAAPGEAAAPAASGRVEKSKKRRLRRFAAAAISGSLLLALVAAEAILRLANPLSVRERASWHFLVWEGMRPSADPELVWEHAPGYRRRLVGYDVAINSLGFRGPELPPEKTPGRARIMCLGDSMTFGMSVGEDDCYPAILGQIAEVEAPGRFEVVNAGILATTTLQQEALMRRTADAVSPDVVVLWWYHNDTTLTGSANPASQEEELRWLLGWKPRTAKSLAIHWGYEALPCVVALARALTVGRGDGDASRFRFDPAANPEGWKANRASLERIADLCAERGVSLVVYSFGSYPHLVEFCAEAGIPYVHTVEVAGAEHEELYSISRFDPHFARKGNALVAETVLNALLALPAPSPVAP